MIDRMMYEAAQASNPRALTSIEDYLAVIGRRKWIVLGFALGGLIIAYLVAGARTPTYEASSTVLVNPTPVGSPNANLLAPKLDREIQVVSSDEISDTVASGLTEARTELTTLELRQNLEVGFSAGSDVIEITYTSANPELAAEVANSYATAYVEARVSEQISYYETQISAVEDELSLLEADRDDLSEQLGQLTTDQSDLNSTTGLTAAERSAAQQIINSSRSIVQTDLNGVAGRLRTVETSRTTLTSVFESQAEAGRVLSTAGVPDARIGLGNVPVTAAGLLVGLILGISAASLIDRLDRSASNPDEVSLALETSVLGTVPQFLNWRSRRGAAAVVMRSDSRTVRAHQAREAFRRLRTAVEYMMRVEDIKTVLITSSKPGEGKSVTASNLAVALASSGVKVALINGDMRRPTLELLFGEQNGSGGLAPTSGPSPTHTKRCFSTTFPDLPSFRPDHSRPIQASS